MAPLWGLFESVGLDDLFICLQQSAYPKKHLCGYSIFINIDDSSKNSPDLLPGELNYNFHLIIFRNILTSEQRQ